MVKVRRDLTEKCGYIALLGQPNAGKSTLLNAMVGTKVAVVSRKPQTTRNRILGSIVEGRSQLLFLDTPGIHRARGTTLLNSALNNVAIDTNSEADVICYLIDIAKGFEKLDARFLANFLSNTTAPFLVLVTKCDTRKKVEEEIAMAGISMQFHEWLESQDQSIRDRILEESPRPTSAKQKDLVIELRQDLARQVPDGPWLFDEDDITDASGTFLCSELIREQIFRQLGQELPYGSAVKIASIEEGEKLVRIHASIVLSSKHHKPIVLGKGGSRIKSLGMESRKSLEKYFDKKVFLDLHVEVASGWTNDMAALTDFAHLQQ
jgi:GTP-binding protein Era